MVGPYSQDRGIGLSTGLLVRPDPLRLARYFLFAHFAGDLPHVTKRGIRPELRNRMGQVSVERVAALPPNLSCLRRVLVAVPTI